MTSPTPEPALPSDPIGFTEAATLVSWLDSPPFIRYCARHIATQPGNAYRLWQTVSRFFPCHPDVLCLLACAAAASGKPLTAWWWRLNLGSLKPTYQFHQLASSALRPPNPTRHLPNAHRIRTTHP